MAIDLGSTMWRGTDDRSEDPDDFDRAEAAQTAPRSYIVVRTTPDGEDTGYWEGFKTVHDAEKFRASKAWGPDGRLVDDTFSITDENFELIDGHN